MARTYIFTVAVTTDEASTDPEFMERKISDFIGRAIDEGEFTAHDDPAIPSDEYSVEFVHDYPSDEEVELGPDPLGDHHGRNE